VQILNIKQHIYIAERKLMQISLRAFSVLLVICSFTAQAAFPDPLINTATVTVPAGVTDPDTSNNSASDSNTLALPTIELTKTGTLNDDDGTAQAIRLVTCLP